MILAILTLLFFFIPTSEGEIMTNRDDMLAASVEAGGNRTVDANPNVRPAQGQGFITIDGPDLKSRLDKAIKQGRSSSQKTRFWIGYSFDVRPEVGVDIVITGPDGAQAEFGGAVIGNLGQYETRNLGIFLFYEQDGNTIRQVEVSNLDRRRDNGGYPVYWLGRAGNQESLDLLTGLVQPTGTTDVAVRATEAVALHNDPRAETMLQNLARNSSSEPVRVMAISWLGRLPGDVTFLTEFARNEHESLELRKRTVWSIARSTDAKAVPTLQSLYDSVSNRQVKDEIIDACVKTKFRSEAIGFLTRVANNDTDPELRTRAQSRLDSKKMLGRKAKARSW